MTVDVTNRAVSLAIEAKRYMEQGDYQKAKQLFKNAINLNPELAYPWNQLRILCQDHLDQCCESEDAYLEAI
ncbi:MAG: tetratricopeptide repeat protein [SAR324 cluster bacterium]|nr:tetratricopeptide repeat protein [SAR324 cluster bacterium]